MADGKTYRVGDHKITVSNLDKVMYPAAGTTKAEVLQYYLEVADYLLPHISGRPVTRKRWVDGVGTEKEPKDAFFRKDLEDSAPEWIPTGEIDHKSGTNVYPLVEAPETLAWLAQVAALELHTPQWRFTQKGAPAHPDRLVLDLDPGEGAGLDLCAQVALWCREILDGMGLVNIPVTSGSKGIHLYAQLDGTTPSDGVSKVAHELARALAKEHPDEVTSVMKKSERPGKVFIDWSQNNGKKTTVSPFSLRGKTRPTVAAPRWWEEIEEAVGNPGFLEQLLYDDLLQRLQSDGDPLAPLAPGALAPSGGGEGATDDGRLDTYRAKRDASKTNEPVPGKTVNDESTGGPIFVIGEHDASSLHWDFRLEHDGVLVSWAVPKGVPLETGPTRLAVQTEDHPLDYASFEGTIPKGQYGAGTVKIWDTGQCGIEKWREGKEIICVLYGRKDGGLGGGPRRFALVHTEDDNWLLKFMQEQPEEEISLKLSDLPAPMIAKKGSAGEIRLSQKEGHRWAFEMKWDGYRMIAGVTRREVVLASRNGQDYTDRFRELGELSAALSGEAARRGGAVVDGEVVALDKAGRPDFGLLHRTKDGEPADIAYMVFDVLALGDEDLTDRPYSARRKLLNSILKEGDIVRIPPHYTGTLKSAREVARTLQLEGLMAKRLNAPYTPGERDGAWLKLKFQLHQEAVVIGAREGKGERSGAIGSLLLAVPDDEGNLRYAGRVGTGFSGGDLEGIAKRLRTIKRKTPAVTDVPEDARKDAWWVTPKLVAEVALAGRTHDGKVRQASWRGWRDDKDPEQVRWEVPGAQGE